MMLIAVTTPASCREPERKNINAEKRGICCVLNFDGLFCHVAPSSLLLLVSWMKFIVKSQMNCSLTHFPNCSTSPSRIPHHFSLILLAATALHSERNRIKIEEEMKEFVLWGRSRKNKTREEEKKIRTHVFGCVRALPVFTFDIKTVFN